MLTTVVGPHPKPVTIKSLVESLGSSDVSVPWVIPICSQGWEALASSPNFLLKEKTKAQKDKVTCPAMHRKVAAEPGPVFSSPSFAVCYNALRHAGLCSTLGLVSHPLESQSGHFLQTLPQEAAICEWLSTHRKCSEHWANSASGIWKKRCFHHLTNANRYGGAATWGGIFSNDGFWNCRNNSRMN